MTDRIPQVTDFEFTSDTPLCPKCGGPMDAGRVVVTGRTLLAYEPSTAPRGDMAYVRRALSCIACGYTELYTSAAEVRCVLAGIKPPGAGSPG